MKGESNVRHARAATPTGNRKRASIEEQYPCPIGGQNRLELNSDLIQFENDRNVNQNDLSGLESCNLKKSASCSCFIVRFSHC
ncbi:hypothetical protein DSM110093_02695 [Sulfitobacter sp. DSM 110093]|nr:hypothetical protein DSM110093_02695 [Sulfitobacter sp. DSM 110093]